MSRSLITLCSAILFCIKAISAGEMPDVEPMPTNSGYRKIRAEYKPIHQTRHSISPMIPTTTKTMRLIDIISKDYREKVAEVMRKPTMVAAASDDKFTADPKIYDWLLEHPDRVARGWQRLNVPCVDINKPKADEYHWKDVQGELQWRVVGRFEQGIIWYAEGTVHPGKLLPTVPVRAVAVLHAPRQKTDLVEEAHFTPNVKVYLLSDSRLANMVMKMIGPAAPRMADQACEQLLFFFSGLAQYLHRYPHKTEHVLAAPKK